MSMKLKDTAAVNISGNAATSSKLGTTDVGSTTQPIYLEDGVATPITYTLGKSVPADAKFTDTTYNDATASIAGLMSADDKAKLDSITESADAVSFVKSLTSGTKIGTITINGTGTDLYCNNDTTYSAITADELSTGTATTARSVTAKVLNEFISGKVSDLVDSAPSTLDTLNELAAALGDDPNFATTMSTELGKKSEKAFANITVGTTTIAADGKEDTLTLTAGNNITITPDATNDKITITAIDTTYTAGTGINLSSNAFSVKYGSTADTACQGNDSRLSDARPASDVSSWAKASSKPTYKYSEITETPTLSTVATSGSYNDLNNKPTIPTIPSSLKNPTSMTIQLNSGTTEGTNKFTYDGSTAKSLNITAGSVGAAESSHTHTKSEISDFPTLAAVATSGSYNDLNNKPTIPTIPSSLKNPELITFKGAGTSVFSYDGSVAKSLDIVAGSNVTVTADATNSKISIAATDTTYSSKSEANGGTAVSLVTTGEKYIWNHKASTAVVTTSTDGLMSASDKSKLDGIATGATNVTTDTVSNWGYTKNTGTVTSIKVGTESYSPSSGVVSLPAYPTTLPASDVSSWAKADSKPTYTYSEVGAAPSEHTHSYLPLSGGSITTNAITMGGAGLPLLGGNEIATNNLGIGCNGIGISGTDVRHDGAAIYMENSGSESNKLIIALGDDSAQGGTQDYIAFRYYDTTGSAAYESKVPFKSGTIALTSDIPTDTNQLTNGAGFTTNTGTVTSVTLTQGTGITVSDSGTAITTTGSRTISLATVLSAAADAGPTSNVTGSHNATIAIPRISVDTYGRVTALGSYNLTCQDTTYSVATASANGLMDATDKSLTNFLNATGTATTLASLDVSKSTIYATLSAATNISLSGTLATGRSITVICKPTKSFTQPIPTSGSFISMDGDSLNVTSGKFFEINIYAYASDAYSISCKIAK